MPTEIVTTDDLREFKSELLEEFKRILDEHSGLLTKKWLKSADVCDLLEISQGKLQTIRINGTIPFTKLGGTIFYNSTEIQKMMTKNMQNVLALRGGK